MEATRLVVLRREGGYAAAESGSVGGRLDGVVKDEVG
jgi:hypothetical protein